MTNVFHDGTCGLLGYDLTGNLKNLTDSKGNLTSWNYDGLNRLDTKRMPDGTAERYGYDVANRALSRTDAQGRVTKSFFDPNGNLTRLDRPGAANDVTISYDGLDRPFQMTDNLGVTTYGFDNLDRISSIDGPWANDTQTYGYDNMGRRKWMRINGGDEVDYDYDPLGRMKTIAGISGTFTANYVGNTSRLDNLQLPTGSKAQYAYDGLNRLTQIQNLTGGGATISKYAYGYGDTDGLPGYDNTSRRTFVDAQVGAQPLKRTLFHYDDVGQLKSEVEGSGAELNRTYAYDAMGNRQSQTSNEPSTTSAPATQTSFTRNPLNQITASTSTFSNAATPTSSELSYDASGNLMQVMGLSGTGTSATPTGASEYAYNDEDKLEEIIQRNSAGTITGKSVFIYDGLGRKRISREFTYNAATQTYTQTEEIRRIYDGMDVVQERDGNNVVKTNYVRAGNIGGLLSKSKRTSGQADVHLYYHYDAQGNVVQLTNATQMTVATYAYDAWGNARDITGSEAAGNRYRFSTKEVHLASGLYDYGLRFYSPGLGRWINRDPIAEEGGINLYAAFGNSPTNTVDEYGENPIVVAMLVGGLTSVATGYVISKFTGQEYTLKDAAGDFLVGAAFSGLAGVGAKALQGIYKVKDLGKPLIFRSLTGETQAFNPFFQRSSPFWSELLGKDIPIIGHKVWASASKSVAGWKSLRIGQWPGKEYVEQWLTKPTREMFHADFGYWPVTWFKGFVGQKTFSTAPGINAAFEGFGTGLTFASPFNLWRRTSWDDCP